MRRFFDCARTLATLLSATLLGALLGGCMLTSDVPLIADNEAVTPLPAAFTMYIYEATPDGYAVSKDAPGTMALEGKGYVTADKAMTTRFVPLGVDTYLVAVSASDGSLYGVGRYVQNVLSLHIILSDTDPGAIIEAERASASAEDLEKIAAITVEEGALKLTSRAALDYVIALYQAGKLTLAPMVMFIAADPNAAAPKTLKQNGEGWTLG